MKVDRDIAYWLWRQGWVSLKRDYKRGHGDGFMLKVLTRELKTCKGTYFSRRIAWEKTLDELLPQIEAFLRLYWPDLGLGNIIQLHNELTEPVTVFGKVFPPDTWTVVEVPDVNGD